MHNVNTDHNNYVPFGFHLINVANYLSIEHLEPDVLAHLPNSVFGCLQPDVAVITTPNSEFNVVFPNFEGFRHIDHKFEWTREEFKQW